ncbi:hypothetical protein SAMN06295885_0059 [Rathayibacter oskolensis]|uniref:Uncharacterized protein n=1 Tax=Rathayibacter oskolensis TaxID=1891671 RepID=A0A1X7MUP5_9MICO|nr:hypothetical protein [Rathayibacter oskolensis]SMH27847.1 hypothetical protein SAMN06295885_0059 [Rathayibacter oskolensis]
MHIPVLTRRTVLQAVTTITAVGTAWAHQPAAAATSIEPVIETAIGRYVMVGLL